MSQIDAASVLAASASPASPDNSGEVSFAQTASGPFLPPKLDRKVHAEVPKEDAGELVASTFFGYMYKKCPEVWKLRPWQQRFFVISEMKVSWWTTHHVVVSASRRLLPPMMAEASLDDASTESTMMRAVSSGQADSSRRGGFNFRLCSAVIEADAKSPTVFTVRPKNGKWCEGATTDRSQDKRRVYIFDTKDSGHNRERWMAIFCAHVDAGERSREREKLCGTTSISSVSHRGSESWDDDSICQEQAGVAMELARTQPRQRPLGFEGIIC